MRRRERLGDQNQERRLRIARKSQRIVHEVRRQYAAVLAYVVIRLDVAAKAGADCCQANRLMHKLHGTKIC